MKLLQAKDGDSVGKITGQDLLNSYRSRKKNSNVGSFFVSMADSRKLTGQDLLEGFNARKEAKKLAQERSIYTEQQNYAMDMLDGLTEQQTQYITDYNTAMRQYNNPTYSDLDYQAGEAHMQGIKQSYYDKAQKIKASSGMDAATFDYYVNNLGTLQELKKTAEYTKKTHDILTAMPEKQYGELKKYNEMVASKHNRKNQMPGTSETSSTGWGTAELDDFQTFLDNQNAIKEYKDALLKKYGISSDEFEKLAQYVNEDVTREETEAELKRLETEIESAPVAKGILYSAESILTSPIAGLGAAMESINALTYADKDAPVNTNAKLYRQLNRSETTERAVGEEINNPLGEFMYGVGMSTAKSALSMATGSQAFTLLSFGSSAYASTLKAAQDKGLPKERAMSTALAAGVAEGLFEKMSLDHIYGMLKQSGKVATKKAIFDVFMQAGIEGTEELFTETSNIITDMMINGEFSDYEWKVKRYMASGMSKEEAVNKANEEAAIQVGKSFLAGMVSGGITGGVVTGVQSRLSANEKAVVNTITEERIKEREKDDKKLTDAEKRQIRKEVRAEMEKGAIDTDKIESILGGDSYNAYKGLSDEMDEFNTLNKMKAGDMTGEQSDRLAELKEKNKSASYESEKARLKDELSRNVMTLTQNDRLRESYNEKARRSQAFAADTKKYKSEAAQKTIQNAMDSGNVNNTNRAHEFVERLAKISEDKGIVFNFSDSKKITELGYGVDGKIVNGYVQGDAVTLNMNSPQMLEKVVGHEIAHFLEGTDHYDALQQVMEEYVNLKEDGAYAKRLAEITELYKDVKEADAKKELLADLVGEYLFTDEAFVRHLSTKNRNLFQRIYDEIKYLMKTFKGTKEGKKLEEVKRVFDKVYRTQGNIAGKVQSSFTSTKAVEQTKDLLAVNNLRAAQVEEALDRDSFIMPSFAVTNLEHSDFGEISFIFDKGTIDPEVNAETMLFGADAWTPQQKNLKKNAQFDMEATNDFVETIKDNLVEHSAQLFDVTPDQFANAVSEKDGSVIDAYAHNLGFQAAYAMENGIIDSIPTNERGMVDKVALKAELENVLDTDDGWRQYRIWMNNVSDSIISNYDVATNEDLINNMKSQPSSAKQFKLSENGKLIVPAKEYGSIEEFRQNKSRLSENAQESTDKTAKSFLQWAKDVSGKNNISTKDVVNAINQSFDSRYETTDIAKVFREQGIELTTEDASRLQELYKEAVELPTKYFEAKAQREVGFDEVMGAVVPNNIDPSLKQRLEDKGIKVVEYDPNIKGDRKRAMNEFEEYKFSLSSKGNSQSNTKTKYSLEVKDYLNEREQQMFWDKIGERKSGTYFPKSRNGDSILTINNKLVYTGKGYMNPKVNRIVEVVVEEDSDIEVTYTSFIQEDIINEYETNDRYKNTSIEEYTAALQNYYSNATGRQVNITTDNGYSDKANGRNGVVGKRQVRERANYHFEDEQDGTANTAESREGKGRTQYSVSETPLESRVTGDALLDAQDLIAEIEDKAEISPNGYVTLYHRTTADSAKKIRESGKMSSKEDGIFFSTKKNSEYTEGYGSAVVELRVPVEKLMLDDIFESEAHLRIPLKNRNQILDVSNYLVEKSTPTYSLSEDSLKQKQLDIILSTNPANDDYHTWIRGKDDILTFEEALNSDDYVDYKGENFDDSYPYSIAEEALETGKITVYSSYPIGQGIFVSPSYMEAKMYAGNGKVYSKKVNLTDVAWIDPTQGQYAKVDVDYSLFTTDDIAPTGKGTYGKDIALDIPIRDDIAPVQESAAVEDIAPIREDIPKVEDVSETEDNKLAKKINKINKHLEVDKAELYEDFQQRKAEAEEELQDQNVYISKKAMELYQELKELKKGVKASEQLGYLLDYGYEWRDLKTALLNVRAKPDRMVNQNSEIESIVRQMISEDFENRVAEIGNIDEEYQRQLEELEKEAKEKRKAATVARQRIIKQQEYRQWVRDLIGSTAKWVDKKMGLSYKVNTLRRNLRDIVRDENGNRNIQLADRIYDALQGMYNHNEALLNREANKIKEFYRKLKINAAEDAYIQMLGEYRHNPDTTILAEDITKFYNEHKNEIDTQKVDKIIDSARELYDNLFVRVNEVLKEQGMQEIGYRKGYFPHFTEDKQSWLAKLFNWKTKNNDIPTDIAGLTEQFNPGRSWQSFNKHRTGDSTDYSFMKGLDTYVNGALDWIYHIEDIQKRRAFENEIRYRHSEKGIQEKIEAIQNNEEYDAEQMQEQMDLVYREAGNPLNNFVSTFRTQTNTLAGKKSSMDRQMEEDLSRRFYSVVTNVSNRVTANMVVGSVSSAITNFIPITQSWAEVSPFSSVVAMKETLQSYVKDDGVIDKSTFLTNRLKQNKSLYQSKWDKIIDKAGILMEWVDNFASQTVWRSKYRENISNGMSENEAIKNADQFAENVIAGRSRGNTPAIFDSKNPMIKVVTAFQLEVNNQYQYMFKDLPQDMQNEAKWKLAAGYGKMFIGAYVYNMLYSALTGRDAAFDPIGIIEGLLRDMGLFGDDEEEETKDVLINLTESIAEEIPFVGGLLGGGRVPISSGLPYDGISTDSFKEMMSDLSEGNMKNFWQEMLNPVYYVAMPAGGGQLKKTVQGLSMFDDDLPIAGSYTNSGNLRYSVEDTLLNRIQAGIFGQWANKNAQEYIDSGRSPLQEKQIQELADLDIPMFDYWKYSDGIKNLETLDEKADYIAGLDLPIGKKNILINNQTTRKDPIDLTDYDKYGSLDELDFAVKNPGKYAVSKAVGGYSSYVSHTKEIGKLEADKDKNGNSISGSRKKKVANYINGLDLDYGEKIILYRSCYTSDDKYNSQIVEYLNSRDDISYNDMVTILQELGMTVDSNGNVRW